MAKRRPRGIEANRFQWETEREKVPSISALAFSPDAAFLASGGGNTHGVNIWDSRGLKHLLRFPNIGNSVSSMAYQPGVERLAVTEKATVLRGSEIRVLDVSLEPLPDIR